MSDLASLLNATVLELRELIGQKSPGATLQWSDDRLWQLLGDFLVVKSKYPQKSDSEVCSLLTNAKWFRERDSSADDYDGLNAIRAALKGRYADIDAKTVRRKLQDARNPACNGILAAALSDPRNEFSREDLIYGTIGVYEDDAGEIHLKPRHYPPRGRRKS